MNLEAEISKIRHPTAVKLLESLIDKGTSNVATWSLLVRMLIDPHKAAIEQQQYELSHSQIGPENTLCSVLSNAKSSVQPAVAPL